MATSTSTDSLSSEQVRVLFDVLTHHETYREIQDFKFPGAIQQYGPPFQDNLTQSGSPILQSLVSRFALKLPGLCDVSPDFWKTRVADLIEELAEAELSESYDKGLLGVRKTLATAVSALAEYPARGYLTGVRKTDGEGEHEYDPSNPDDVLRAWHDALYELVYGDLTETMFAKAAETDDLQDHPSLVQAMHEFVIVNVASLMHYTLVLSPEGPTLLRMINSVHRLIPYLAIRQALKIGNVATMISAVMKIVLTKASMGSVTNWIGLTSGADEGMNLLQQIINQVLGWDKRELRKRADKLESSKDAPPKEVFVELRNWITNRSREEHEECRRQSRDQNMSIVAVIMATSPLSIDLTPTQHAIAHEYLALHLGVRDRDEIIRILCRRNPDHLTALVKDGVDAYTPMIRNVHQAVNLSDTVWDFERFVTDMLKTSKPSGPKGEEKPPSVEDYVDLLHRHQSSSHKFLHQVAKNGKEVTSWWKDWVHMAASQFRHDDASSSSPYHDARTALLSAFSSLSSTDQEKVKAELAAWSRYLDNLHAASASRIRAVITRDQGSSPTEYGPGAYLARWQHLLDSTVVTPAEASGPVRYGGSRSVRVETRKDIVAAEEESQGKDDEKELEKEEEAVEAVVEKATLKAPKVDETVRLLGRQFREIVARVGSHSGSGSGG